MGSLFILLIDGTDELVTLKSVSVNTSCANCYSVVLFVSSNMLGG